jgi:membrane protein DedA with SNARE-associated domain
MPHDDAGLACTIRYGTWIGFGETDLVRAKECSTVAPVPRGLVCRCIPLIRPLISIPAGFRHMPLVTFTLFTLIGTFVWNTILITSTLGAWREVHDG